MFHLFGEMKLLQVLTGILIAAFSGGRSEDDYKVSQAGLAVLAANGL